jgi:hypothetical protein
MAQTFVPREKLQLQLSSEAKEQLRRVCRFADVSMTRWIERMAANAEKQTIEHLTDTQREEYLAGRLHRLQMSPEQA